MGNHNSNMDDVATEKIKSTVYTRFIQQWPNFCVEKSHYGILGGVFQHQGGFVFVFFTDERTQSIWMRNDGSVTPLPNEEKVSSEALEIFRPYHGHHFCLDEMPCAFAKVMLLGTLHIAIDLKTKVAGDSEEAFNSPTIWSGYICGNMKGVEGKWSFAQVSRPSISALELHMLPVPSPSSVSDLVISADQEEDRCEKSAKG